MRGAWWWMLAVYREGEIVYHDAFVDILLSIRSERQPVFVVANILYQ